MTHLWRITRILIALLCLCSIASFVHQPTALAQNNPKPQHESKFVNVRGIRLHYLDFGGSGLPVVFLQSFHGDAREWAAFAPRFADAYRVLALTRRGWGESDDVGWGYDTATQAEDALGFLNALGIRRAVLVGRFPATGDMTYLAEHHPERLAGLIYLMPPFVGAWTTTGTTNKAVQTFHEMTWRASCDLGEEAVPRTAARTGFRPHYLDDDSVRINIPALSFEDASGQGPPSNFLDLLLKMTAAGRNCDKISREYFTALAADADRLAALRRLLAEQDRTEQFNRGFARAFGSNLRRVRMEKFLGQTMDRMFDSIFPHVRKFLEELTPTR